MRTKTISISVFLALALLLSACAAPQQAAVPQPNAAPPRSLSVNGNAQISLTPDIAYINIGVHSEDSNAAEAVAQNNAKSQAVSAALTGMGVDAKDILTTNFSIYPQDEWGPDGQRIGTRFIVDNTVYVTLRDLSKVGEVIGVAVDAGANSINGIQFDVADKTPLLGEGRKAAVENARLQAEELAKAAGVELGPVQSISFYNSIPSPVLMDMKGVGGGGAAMSVPVSPGQLTISVDVGVIYEIR